MQQIGSPQELYNNPVNLFVAGFIGSPSMNFIPGRLGADAIDTPIGRSRCPTTIRSWRVRRAMATLIGIRPENLEDAALIVPRPDLPEELSPADIGVLESMGSDKYAYFDLDHQGASHADAASVGAASSSPGSPRNRRPPAAAAPNCSTTPQGRGLRPVLGSHLRL